jgi:mannitol operon transcriptional antiterminator
MPEKDYVQVRPFLSADEVEQITDHLREKWLNARLADRAASESLEVLGGGQTRFRQMAEATQTIAELMEDFFLERQEAGGSVTEAVRRICASLAERGLISDPRRLEEALLARLELGGIGIPDTSLALFHARNDAAERPVFSVHDFDEALDIEGMDGEPMLVRRSLLMVAPMELSPVALEAISEISVAIVERPAEREVFEGGSEEQILATLQRIFARFLQNKLL